MPHSTGPAQSASQLPLRAAQAEQVIPPPVQGGMCSVYLKDSEKVVSISSEHLEPITPTKNNKVERGPLGGHGRAARLLAGLTRQVLPPGESDSGRGPGGHRGPAEY